MKRLARFRRALFVGLVAAAATLSMTQVAQAANASPHPPTVPEEIRVPSGNKLSLVAHATGVQIYTCNGTTWGSSTPRADLFADKKHQRLIGTHFGGPTWKATDGSTVVGVVPPEGSVTVDPTAIPWLLLRADPGDTPGRFARTTFIQRVATVGGLAPAAAECNAGAEGRVAEVPYTADYYFWTER
jgi:hypothetical protein